MPAIASPPSTPSPTTKSAPAPAAKAAPTARPELAAPPESNEPFNDAFSELETMDTGKPKPQPKKEEKKPEAKVQAKPESEDAQSDEAEVAEATTTDKQKDEVKPEAKPVKAAELRNAYEGLKKKIKEEYEPKLKKLTEYESRIKEYETKNPEAEKKAKEEFESIRKRNEELESSIRFSNYKLTKEYKEHETNLSNAWASAKDKLAGISVSSKNPDTEEISQRELTLGDIAGYANLEPKERWSRLRSEIPDPAERTMVINHIDKIVDLSKTLDAAEKKALEDSEVHAKTMREQQEQSQRDRARFWRESNEGLSKKFPQWFSKVEGDSDGNALLDRGAALADLIFSPEDLTPERIELLPKSVREQIASKKPFTQKQLAELHSIVRNKAANHDRAVKKSKALEARIVELEASLKEFEESSPDNVRAGTTNGAKAGDTGWEAELDAIERKNAR